jgi:8-oxo-dGTP pyrophosphatase MutT (NUDIX family)
MRLWKVLKSENIIETRGFRIRKDECQLPDGRIMPRYYIFEFLDWAQIVPVTEAGELVMLSQYRHGAGLEFEEIPGGSLDEGEEPRQGAERELLEETGYSASEWIQLPPHYPNPALQNNRVHSFVALGCKKLQEPQPDPFEDLKVYTVPLKEVYSRLRSGLITHSLMNATLTLAEPHLSHWLT